MKKGITFIAVLTAVAIMFILVSTVTISAINVTNNAKKTKFATEIAYIKEAVDNYYILNGNYPISESIVLESNNNNIDVQFKYGEGNGEFENILYKIDKTKIGITDTVYGNGNVDDKDLYVFSKETKRVYYLKGLSVGNKIYYTLTDELKKLIQYNNLSVESISESSEDENENDKIGPNITIENKKKSLITTDGSEKIYYVTVKVTDEKSGIKIIKFEREIMTEESAKVYFKTNGIELQEEIIEVEENTKGITVYAEDNAGNLTIEIVDFSKMEGEENE